MTQERPKIFDKLMEMYDAHQLEAISRSWCVIDQDERKCRLSAILKLAVELDRIRSISTFSTRLAESAVEAVIEGDWKSVERYAGYFTFEDESEELRAKHAPLWKAFVEILRDVHAAGIRAEEKMHMH